MNIDQALALTHAFFQTVLLVAMPVLMASLIAGLVVGLLQAATQVNEASLSYVVKAVAVLATLAVVGPTVASEMVRYTKASLQSVATVVR